MDLKFPMEFLVFGTPVSLQAKRPATRDAWKALVREASKAALPENHFASDASVAVTLLYFPSEPMQGDIDNIVKPILDAFCQYIYLDDRQVERLVVQKFEPERTVTFVAPTQRLTEALVAERPVLYIRISDTPLEDAAR
ncbi:MAG: hypothetical protein CML23_23030 [Rhizobiaceae bacterium]|nr:hypothetical protein [Rhizobiaceae bacterium]|tara:strand:- start:990 stop:1406 length:417 start_codon:yes stop_codon:yes gene_type:complete